MALGGSGSGGAGAIRAGRAFVELFGEDAALRRTLASWEGKLKSFAGFATKLGAGMFAGGAALLAPLTAAVGTLQDLAKQGDIAKAFGLTTEAFTGIAGVAKSAGEDTREFIESLVTLGKVASEGAAGKGEAATEFFKELNLNAAEFAALKPDEQFFKFFEAVKKVEDPLRRVRLLMTAFGEDGGKYLLPLLEKSDAELRNMADGFAVSAKDVEAATKAASAYVDAVAVMNRAWQAFAVAVAPALTEVFREAQNTLAPLAAFIARNAAAVGGVVMLTVALLAGGAALIGFAAVMSGVGTIIGAVSAALGFVATPVGAVTAAIVGLSAYWLTMTEGGRRAASGLAESFQALKAVAGTTFGGIIDALQIGDLEGAFDVALKGVTSLWKEAIVAWQKLWVEFQATFIGQTIQDLAGSVGTIRGPGGAGSAGGSGSGGGGLFDDITGIGDLFTQSLGGWTALAMQFNGQYKESQEFLASLDKVRKEEFEARRKAAEAELRAAQEKAALARWELDAKAKQMRQARELKEEEDSLAKQTAEMRRKAAEEYARNRDPKKAFEAYALDSKNWKRDREQEEMAKRLGLTLPKSAAQAEVEAIRKEYLDRTYQESLNRIAKEVNGGIEAASAMAGGKGGFGGPLAAQFGVGDSIQRRSLDTLENIDEGVKDLPKDISRELGRQLVVGER